MVRPRSWAPNRAIRSSTAPASRMVSMPISSRSGWSRTRTPRWCVSVWCSVRPRRTMRSSRRRSIAARRAAWNRSTRPICRLSSSARSRPRSRHDGGGPMSGTVTVASRLSMALRIYNTADPKVYYDLIGERDLDSPEIPGWGLTYEVDGATLNQFLSDNPHLAAFITTVTQQQIDDHQDPMNTHGYELGFEPTVPPIETPPPVNRDVPYVWQEEQRMRCTMG